MLLNTKYKITSNDCWTSQEFYRDGFLRDLRTFYDNMMIMLEGVLLKWGNNCILILDMTKKYEDRYLKRLTTANNNIDSNLLTYIHVQQLAFLALANFLPHDNVHIILGDASSTQCLSAASVQDSLLGLAQTSVIHDEFTDSTLPTICEIVINKMTD